jgi:hypothetical protein
MPGPEFEIRSPHDLYPSLSLTRVICRRVICRIAIIGAWVAVIWVAIRDVIASIATPVGPRKPKSKPRPAVAVATTVT